MDRIGKAATNMLGAKHPDAPTTAMASAEQRLIRANKAAQANPGSVQAKQGQLTESLKLLKEMQAAGLPANDPRRVKIAGMIVGLANQLGPAGIPRNIPGLDVVGMLRVAAGVISRFGDGAGMQAGFTLEQVLRSMVSGSSPEALKLLDALVAKFGIDTSVGAMLKNGWKIRLAGNGEAAHVDPTGREMVLDAAKHNASLGVLAKAFWNDVSLNNPADKDGFMRAFLKIANQGHLPVLNRKYKEVRQLARHQLMSNPKLSAMGNAESGSIVTMRRQEKDGDESGDMFSALAVFSQTDQSQIPESLHGVLGRFFA